MTRRMQYCKFEKGEDYHLMDERLRLLRKVGFIFEANKEGWEKKLEKLQEYKEKNGVKQVYTKLQIMILGV